MEVRLILECVEEHSRLPEIFGVEPFREPAINPQEHLASPGAIAPIGKQLRVSRRTAQLPRLCLLRPSDIDRGTKTSLRFLRVSLQHEHPRPQPQQLSVVRPLFSTFGGQDTRVNQRPRPLKVSGQSKTLPLQASQVPHPETVAGCLEPPDRLLELHDAVGRTARAQ